MSENSNEQQLAFDELLSFLLNPLEKEIALTGPPGSGKSYLISQLLSKLDIYTDMAKLTNQKPLDYVFITGSTNQSVAVLKEYIPRHLFSQASTLCSLLKGKVINDYKTGQTSLHFNPKYFKELQYQLNNSLIVVDEGYSVSRDQITYLRNVTKGLRVKIIYVGDRYQTPPVKEAKSILLDSDMKMLELTEIRRTDDADLQSAIMQLRDWFKYQKPIHIQANGISIRKMYDSEYEQELSKFSTKPEGWRALAYDNYTVGLYTDYISSQIGKTDHLEVNSEYLVFNSGNNTNISVDSVVTIKQIQPNYDTDWPVKTKRVLLNTKSGSFWCTVAEDNTEFNSVLKQLKKDKNWTKFFTLQDSVVALSDGYTSTIHKAQGSTFKRVFLDLSSLKNCTSTSLGISLLYVAFSRPSDEIILFGELPKRFGVIS